jgi:hypothetical protein
MNSSTHHHRVTIAIDDLAVTRDRSKAATADFTILFIQLKKIMIIKTGINYFHLHCDLLLLFCYFQS